MLLGFSPVDVAGGSTVTDALAALSTLDSTGYCQANGVQLDGLAELAVGPAGGGGHRRRALRRAAPPASAPDECDAETFRASAAAVTASCCDATTQSCADGVASSCDAKCGMQYVPFYRRCMGALARAKFSPALLAAFANLDETCRALPVGALLAAVAQVRLSRPQLSSLQTLHELECMLYGAVLTPTAHAAGHGGRRGRSAQAMHHHRRLRRTRPVWARGCQAAPAAATVVAAPTMVTAAKSTSKVVDGPAWAATPPGT